MGEPSKFTKYVIWFMVFLMCAGFVALVVAPFVGGGSSDRKSTAEAANDTCAGFGGVESVDGRSGTVVCRDGQARQIQY